jgi:thymidylate synthase (FAD)
MHVQLIAATIFAPPADVPWATDADDGPALVEFAGRACYQSWNKPNPATATNAGYIAHLLDVGHLSVLEHASVSFYVTGISRSCSHELVRHRHLNFSQLSQRYVDSRDVAFIMPDVIAGDPMLRGIFRHAAHTAQAAYEQLLINLDDHLQDLPAGTARRKAARQAARAVLPNAAETRMVVTGNYRAWRHVLAMRGSAAADVEIRTLAVQLGRLLKAHAPAVFGDFEIHTLPDGTDTMTSIGSYPQDT